jgi:hypothetical protein
VTVLNDIAVVAAAILILELLVLIFVFLGIAGGLAFGLTWLRGKSGAGYRAMHRYAALGTRYAHMGTDYAAKPVIVTAGLAGTARGTMLAIRRRVEVLHAQRPGPPSAPVAAVPVSPQPNVPSVTPGPGATPISP